MESEYYSKDGGGDVESTDGGVNDNLYEVGTDMIIPIATSAACYDGI